MLMQNSIERIPNCPFCLEDIDEITFMESDNFRVIYNYSPIVPGHSLVIPKSHIESLLDIGGDKLNELVSLSIKAARFLTKAFKSDSFNWTVQEKAAAGQSVSHLHLHIIPRHDGDLPQPGDWYPRLQASEHESDHVDSQGRPKYDRKQVVDIAFQLRSKFHQYAE